MLCGFCLLLASYRAAQIRDWWRRRAEGPAEEAEPASSEKQLVFSVLAAGLMAAALITMVLPASIGLWLTLPITILVPAVLTVLIVHTRGWRRAFCIGALAPAGMAASTGLVLLWMIVESTTYQQGPWTSVPVLARSFRFFAIVCWLLMFAGGGIAAAVYVAGQRRQE